MRFNWMLTIAAAVVCLGPARAQVVERNTSQKTFTYFGGSGRKLIIDDVNGAIDVVAYSGSEVQVTVNEYWKADDATKMQEGRREVTLDMSQQGNVVRLYVDGPFRCRGGCDHQSRRTGYRASFDFQVKVPADAELELKTVNGGHIKAENSNGNFVVSNVNGGIELLEMAGSGQATTVNGGVTVTFRENPRAPSSFKSVNGELAVSFRPDLAADFLCKTFNGGVYTDFEAALRPMQMAETEKHGTRNVYRSNRFNSIRIGAGGPEHKFDTLNGNIRIIKRG
ncbi:MAG: hypothetical protein ABJF23_30135 [Bryobacteraceae bacterium]